MYIINIQLLSDKDYGKTLPEGFVINAKSLEMKKAIIQVAKRNENDTKKVYHLNTDEFVKSHPDAVEGTVSYVTDPVTKRLDIVAAVEPSSKLIDYMTEITGKMLHRTQVRAAALSSEFRKNKQMAKEEAAKDSTEEVSEAAENAEMTEISNETEEA